MHFFCISVVLLLGAGTGASGQPNSDLAASDTITLNPENIERMALFGQVWGFLKYHHPAAASGKINFDQEFLRILPSVVSSGSDNRCSSVIETWLLSLGPIETCRQCDGKINQEVILLPDYGDLFSNSIFSNSLLRRLAFIRDNANNKSNYYISLKPAKNPSFDHEITYSSQAYPNVGLRLLGLMRYWAMVQYFSPNRELVAMPWRQVIRKFIPQMVLARDKKEYAFAVARLISTTRDTHAFIGSQAFLTSVGMWITPFAAIFIGNKLVVTSNYADPAGTQVLAQPGDVVLSINGVMTDDLVKRFLPIVSASNLASAKRDLPIYHLLRSDSVLMKFMVERNGKTLEISQRLIPYNVRFHTERFTGIVGQPGYEILQDSYMYIRSSGFHKKDYKKMREQISRLKGIIVDLRCYPSDNLIATLITDLKSKPSPFVKLSYPVIARPGLFVSKMDFVGGGGKIKEDLPVVVLVNEVTQSHAEYVAMAFAQLKNAKVIGSQTSGADGNVSLLSFPGGIYSNISGLGVYYPDGKNAQGKGVKIDVQVIPSIEGIRDGRDEVLEKAIEMLNSWK